MMSNRETVRFKDGKDANLAVCGKFFHIIITLSPKIHSTQITHALRMLWLHRDLYSLYAWPVAFDTQLN